MSITYEFVVKVTQYQTARVQVTASDYWQAKAMVEAQYGVGNVYPGGEVSDPRSHEW